MNHTRVARCVLYARISVTAEESVSIARQLESGRKYAAARGWTVVGEFVDDGVSATANRPEDRKGWAALLDSSEFEAVVIWKVDRLARRVLDFLRADEALQSLGAGLVAVDDPIDMTTPQGRALAVMLAVFGEMEAAATSARIRAARIHLLSQGRWPGGGVPYGYVSQANPNGPGKILAKDAERIDWLTRAVRMAQRGAAIWTISEWLSDQGAPLPRWRRKAGNDRWHHNTVLGLLRNPILAGLTPHNPGRAKNDKQADPLCVVRHDNGEPLINSSLAVITVDEFTALQQALDCRSEPQTRKRSERRATSPLLSRVARCDACDVFMARGTNQQRAVLYCPRCRQTQTRATLDPYVINRLLDDRGSEPLNGATVQLCWDAAGDDVLARRDVLLSQLDSLRIRRGIAGKYFDEDRVLIRWDGGSED